MWSRVYSPTWDTFVGHRKEVETLLNSKRAAEKRGEPLRPVLLWGPSGCGKTTLARLLGGKNMIEVSGATLEGFSLAKLIFKTRKGGGTILIDEIHALKSQEQELLYPLLDRGEFWWGGRVIETKVSLIGTTTKMAKLNIPLKNRFSITVYLGTYPVDDLAKILHNAAREMGMKCTEEAVQLIADLSRGVPRNALSLLNMARDTSDVVDQEAARKAAAALGYDEYGLTYSERVYIISLYSLGSSASLSVMSTILQQDSSSTKAIEGYLLKKGFVSISSRGRELTLEGMEYAEQVLSEK